MIPFLLCQQSIDIEIWKTFSYQPKSNIVYSVDKIPLYRPIQLNFSYPNFKNFFVTIVNIESNGPVMVYDHKNMSYPFASSTDANKYVIFYAKNNVPQFDVVPLLKGGQYMNITYQQIVMESDSEIQFDMYVSNTVYDATKYERKDSYVFISQLSTNLKYDYFEANIGGGQDNTPFPGQAILNFDQNLIPKQFGRHKTGAIDSVFYFGYMPPDKATTMYCRLSATTNTLKYGGKSTLRLNHMNIKNYGTGQTWPVTEYVMPDYDPLPPEPDNSTTGGGNESGGDTNVPFNPTVKKFLIFWIVVTIVEFIIILVFLFACPNRFYRSGILCNVCYDCCCNRTEHLQEFYENHHRHFCSNYCGLLGCALGCNVSGKYGNIFDLFCYRCGCDCDDAVPIKCPECSCDYTWLCFCSSWWNMVKQSPLDVMFIIYCIIIFIFILITGPISLTYILLTVSSAQARSELAFESTFLKDPKYYEEYKKSNPKKKQTRNVTEMALNEEDAQTEKTFYS